MRGRILTSLTIVAVLSEMPERLLAQDRPAPIVEAVVGRSGFIDEAWDYFTTVGGGARWFVTPRLAIGPEVSYLSGRFDSLDASSLIVTGNITFDFIRDDGRLPVVPYLAAGGGFMRQKTLVGTGPGSTALAPFTSSEATASVGIGARIALGSHVFVAPEFRLGWEPETRMAVTIGIRPGGGGKVRIISARRGNSTVRRQPDGRPPARLRLEEAGAVLKRAWGLDLELNGTAIAP